MLALFWKDKQVVLLLSILFLGAKQNVQWNNQIISFYTKQVLIKNYKTLGGVDKNVHLVLSYQIM